MATDSKAMHRRGTESPLTGEHWVRVYYEDTDHGQVVYHANYLRFFERARTEMLRQQGWDLDQLEREDGVIFTVRRAQLDFRAPARFNQLLCISSRIRKASGVRLTFGQSMEREGQTLCLAEIEVACLNTQNFRPKPIPHRVLQSFFPPESASHHGPTK